MSLYGKIAHAEEPGLNNHAFCAACGEILRGKLTVGAVADAFGLSGSEQGELQVLITRMQNPVPDLITADILHEIALLAESRAGIYATEAALKSRLGV